MPSSRSEAWTARASRRAACARAAVSAAASLPTRTSVSSRCFAERRLALARAQRLGELARRVGAEAQHVLDARAVLALELLDEMQPLLGGREPRRIRRRAVDVAFEPARRVAQLLERSAQPRHQRSERRVESLERAQPARGVGEQIRRVRVLGAHRIADEQRRGGGAVLAQALGVREPRTLRAQALDLARLELRLVDLRHLVREQIAAALAFVRRRAQLGELAGLGTQLCVARGHALALRQQAGAAIEQPAVALGAQQALGFVLARDLEAAAEQLGERRDRHELPADLRATAPAARDAAAHDELVIQHVDAARRELRLQLREPLRSEHGLDDGLLRAVADRLARRAGSGEQRERAEHDGFSGSGFARQHVQPGAELELGALHDRDVLDAQGLDHRAPQRSFVRITSKRLRSFGTRICAGHSERRTVTRSRSASSRPTCPSTVRCTSPPRASCTRIVISQPDESTSGRCVSVCEQIGVSTIASKLGSSSGPPAESE